MSLNNEKFQNNDVCQENMPDKLLAEAAPHGLKIFAKNVQESTSELPTDKFDRRTKGWNSTKIDLINDAANFAFQKTNNKDSDSQINNYSIDNTQKVSLIAATDAMYSIKSRDSSSRAVPPNSNIYTEIDLKSTPESLSAPLGLTRPAKNSSVLFSDISERMEIARPRFEPNTRLNESDNSNQSLKNHIFSRGAAQIAHAETFSIDSKAQQQKSHRNLKDSSQNPSRRHTFIPQNFHYNEKHSLNWHPYHQFRVQNSEIISQEQPLIDVRPFRKNKDDKFNDKTPKSTGIDENALEPLSYDQETLAATAKRNASLSLRQIDDQISAKEGKAFSNIFKDFELNRRVLVLEKNKNLKNTYPESGFRGKKTKISSAKDGASRLLSRVASKKAKNMRNIMDMEQIFQEKEIIYNSRGKRQLIQKLDLKNLLTNLDHEKMAWETGEDTKTGPSIGKNKILVPLDISSRADTLPNKLIKPRKSSMLPVKVPTTLDNTIENIAVISPTEKTYPHSSKVNQELKQEKRDIFWHKPKDWYKMIRGLKLEESVTKNSENIAVVNETSVPSCKSQQIIFSDGQRFFDALEYVEPTPSRPYHNEEEESDSSSEGLIFYDAL
ncbi:Bgh-specific hypothetical protein [Blumeria hordei DH14]|uniref:Uncharacterized protein n=1 Tax=Blumeria graminis f. sp. hordei (strain DH14) TaxID=546991 RepID=N1JJ79_BLUG1|nr:Bgh-specific hypothetical protein [Blumeria hordei DH14]